jgi:hypothetical protein
MIPLIWGGKWEHTSTEALLSKFFAPFFISLHLAQIIQRPLPVNVCRLIPYLHQRPIFFKTNSSIAAILELIRGAQCLIEVIRSSGEEMWCVDAYQIPYYSRGIEGEKISRHCDEWKYIIIGRILESEIIWIPPSLKIFESSSNGSYRNTDEVWWRYGISRSPQMEPPFNSAAPVLNMFYLWYILVTFTSIR